MPHRQACLFSACTTAVLHCISFGARVRVLKTRRSRLRGTHQKTQTSRHKTTKTQDHQDTRQKTPKAQTDKAKARDGKQGNNKSQYFRRMYAHPAK